MQLPNAIRGVEDPPTPHERNHQRCNDSRTDDGSEECQCQGAHTQGQPRFLADRYDWRAGHSDLTNPLGRHLGSAHRIRLVLPVRRSGRYRLGRFFVLFRSQDSKFRSKAFRMTLEFTDFNGFLVKEESSRHLESFPRSLALSQ